MEVRVSGHQVDTGDALQTHAEDRMNAIASKYFAKAISANVTVSKAPHAQFKCDIVTHVMQGLMLKADAEAGDAHQAFEQAADKIEKQLRRYMRRLNDHHVQAQYAAKQEEAAYRVFESFEEEEESELNGGNQHRYSRSQRFQCRDDDGSAQYQRPFVQKLWHWCP